MTVDLRWLTAPDDEVAAAMATLRRADRPSWVPTRRRVLVHVNHSLLLWYLCVILMVFGIRVDSYDDGVVSADVLRGLVVAAVILVVWLYGTYRLHRWAARPPSPRARLAEWRQSLTALANGFEPQASPVATFTSMIGSAGKEVHEYPRFVASGIEFGNLTNRIRRATEWHYVAVTLRAPLPHLILDSTSNDRLTSDLPAGVERGQLLALEAGFDRWFRVYSPAAYHLDALYVLTPDVMEALIDHAHRFNVEIIDDRLVFFRASGADFSATETWRAVDAILGEVASRIVRSSGRYRDERVPGQDVPPVISKIRAAIEHPEIPWVQPRPRIGPDGRRLVVRDRRTGVLSVIGAIGWFAALTFLYAVPGIFAFSGFMSIIDGR